MFSRKGTIDVGALQQELVHTRRELTNVEQNLASTIHRLKVVEDQNRILKIDHGEDVKDMRARSEKLLKEKDSIYSEQMGDLQRAHQRALGEERAKHDRALKEMRANHARIQAKYEIDLKAAETKHLSTVDELKNKHRLVIGREKSTHGQEVKKLVGQLLVNQNDNSGWPDDKIKYKYQQIQSLVKALVSPRHKEARVPAGSRLPSDLDPSKFLERTKTANAHFLLQSIIWEILCQQFFSAPYGFGILGPGNSQRTLLGLLDSLTGLLGRSTDSGTREKTLPTTQGFELFNESVAANNWRSATFQCMYESVIQTSSDIPAPESSIQALAQLNLRQTASRISRLLVIVSGVSKIPPRDELDQEVLEMTTQAQALAFQFGLHTARLQLVVHKQGDEVKIGGEIHECEDGDANRGTKLVVDLVTLPGLQKIGDGGSDKHSKRTIVPCEIYPDQSG